MSSIPTPDEIARDARWLTQTFDPGTELVRLVEMDREAYREVSFLDERMFQKTFVSQLVPMGLVGEAVQKIERNDARWIFHISHVGSTLVARLLGEIAGVLSIREPQFLRDLVRVPPVNRARFAAAAQKLFSRTFAPDEVAVIKTTSFVSEIASELVPANGRALFIYVSCRNFASGILAGPNSMRELHNRAEGRSRRLLSRGINLPAPRNDSDIAAAAWACEMTSLETAQNAMPDRSIDWIDFDRLLEDVVAGLTSSTKALGLKSDIDQLSAIATGPQLGRYSKAPQFEYSPGLRREILRNAIGQHKRELDDALAMLRSAAEKSPLLARAIARSGEA